MADRCRVEAPGRVNLIGDHTDYTGGLVFPMAIDRSTVIDSRPSGSRVVLRSDADPEPAELDLPVAAGDIARTEPAWARHVAAVAAELGATAGITGTVTSTIPVGAGLSSSAALGCALALALGFEGDAPALATLVRRAEHLATGVPTGIMDQLCIASARRGHATMIDCHSLDVAHVPMPDDVDVVVEFVAHRTLEGSAYADRVAECARAEAVLGPLRLLAPADVDGAVGSVDAVAWRRARHVVSENERVRRFAAAIVAGDLDAAGGLMTDSHASLRDDFETSTPAMDAAVARMTARPGVYGARMTGGGFGGCVVALCTPGALTTGWRVSPAGAASRR